MSWLFRALQPDDDDAHDGGGKQLPPPPPESPSSSRAQNDMSFLGRQLRGFASFLAPPPLQSDAAASSYDSPPESPSQLQALSGIRNDLAEIGGSFKTGLSLLSTNSNKAVTEISKFASNLLQLQTEALEDEAHGDDDDDDDDDYSSVPGITDEVIGFVTEISVLPDCWTDFPMPLDHDFAMSDAQREHASIVERLVPGFADLRVGLCSSMSEEQFWIIYFLLLLPRLNEDDFELLSTPKIIEIRNELLQKLQNKRNGEVDLSLKSILGSPKNDEEDGRARGEEMSSQEKEALTETVNAAERLKIDDEESTEHWSEGASISSGTLVDGRKKLESEEDISFSDLEDDENDISSKASGQRRGRDARSCSPSGSNDWVQLTKSSEIERRRHQKASPSKVKDSEGEDSNDWLTVDEFD